MSNGGAAVPGELSNVELVFVPGPNGPGARPDIWLAAPLAQAGVSAETGVLAQADVPTETGMPVQPGVPTETGVTTQLPTRRSRRASQRRPRHRALITTVSALGGLLLAGGGYLVADAHDRVPGFITLAPPDPTAAPFPTPVDVGPGSFPEPVLPPLPVDAPAPDPAEVGELISRFAADPRVGPHVGVVVLDAASGEVLGERNPDNWFTPASTQKVLTALATAVELDPQATLDTTVFLNGNTIVLVGGGDMLLSAGHGSPEAVNGHAGLADLAEQTAAQVMLSGEPIRLLIDDSLFGEPRVAPAVPQVDANAGFVARVASMAINIARLTSAEVSPTAPDPALSVGEEFARQLRELGVNLEGGVGRGAAGEGAREIARVSSAPIADIVEWAMLRSENTITEVLGRLVAIEVGLPATPSGSVEAVTTVVERLGLDLSGATVLDLSGLGRGSLLTPRQLAAATLLSVDTERPELRSVAAHLPIGNLTGTLATRYPGENPGRGRVRAKTGSLPGTTALAGTVVTANDRLLVFAVVADQTPPGGQTGPRLAIDNFVGQLAALGS